MKLKHSVIEPTIKIFERMYANLPPLISEKIQKDMHLALEQVKSNSDLQEEDLERTMIHFAKLIWPEMQAFQEFYNSYEARMAEQIFVQKLTPMLRVKYTEYKNAGHTFEELQRGLYLHFFLDHERAVVHELMVDVVCDIRAFAYQAVAHDDRERYEERIREFRKIRDEIELQLDGLRTLAENEQEHPQLAAEIREHIRGFEHGFAFLGPSVDYQAVCESHVHFAGRKQYLKIRV